MKNFEKKIIVNEKDLDGLDHVNNLVYVKWAIDIAKSHWENIATEKMIKSYRWVLLEHNIKYILPSYLNDKILLKTYIDDTTRIKSKRVVEFYNIRYNKIIAVSNTSWCLINSKSKKIQRINDQILNVFKTLNVFVNLTLLPQFFL